MTVEFDTAVSTTFRVDVHPRTKRSSSKLVKTAHQLGFTSLQACYPSRLYFLKGHFSLEDAERIASEILADPVTEQFSVFSFQFSEDKNLPLTINHLPLTIEVTLLPGVTDPPAENLIHAAQLLGIDGLQQVATGQRYELEGDLDADAIHSIAAEVLANPVIQRFAIDEAITPPFVGYHTADDTVDLIDLREADDDELLEISKERRLSMDLYEMRAIQKYYRAEGRPATDVELEMLAQTWSEHCVHKTFRAVIEYDGPDGQETIHGLLNTYIRAATNEVNKPWVHSAFVDNAGIVAFDDTYDLAFKAETHNHPSALEPFGGANTGVGGVVRDVIGVSARPIANTDVLCFGLPDMDHDELPEGVLHPARIADGVIHGIEDYGNKMGIPTVNGSIHYHPGYTANPLVYCGCVGILPRGSHVTKPQVGDYVVAIGGRTGRDGLRGATFSSMEMDVETSEVAGSSVQIGNPIMEKQTLEVILQARDAKLYTAITDCGAGGFSSAVGEMAETLGADIQLQNITLKYPGLRPWEMWLSEAQERMVLAVPPANLDALQAICDGQDVELIVLGTFSGNGRLHIQYGNKTVAELTTDFLHDGIPTKNLKAEWKPVVSDQYSVFSNQSDEESGVLLLKLLRHPDIRSKEDVIRKYDHEVQGGTAVKPLVGSKNNGPSDATVLVPQNSLMEVASGKWQVASDQSPIPDPQSPAPSPQPPIKGAAISNGINPYYSALDPYNMAWAAIDEAMRNAVAVGADPDQVAILDNFCWGNPSLPDRLGSLVRCAQGCYDAAIAFGTPYVSGKDSLYNEYTGADGEKHAIPGTLLISALGIVPDVNQTTTMDLKAEGNLLFVVGDTRAELGGSHLHLIGGAAEGGANSPAPVKDSLARMRKLHGAIRAGLVQACHDCAEGGLAVSLAEMCLAGGLGAVVDITAVPTETTLSDNTLLFSESLSRFVVEVKPEDADAFVAQMVDVPLAQIGVVQGDALVVNGRSGELVSVGVEELEKAWRGEVSVQFSEASVQSKVKTEYRTLNTEHKPKVLILHANGSNRDHDAALACELAGGEPEIVHINQLAAGERKLADYGMLVIPGGFSYGDDLGAGVLWSLDLKYKFGEELRAFVENGRPVLGICNGFQTLVKAGLLPGVLTQREKEGRLVTLTFNRSDHFECRWVYLQPNPNSPSLFTQGLTEPIYCPVAHGEGRLAVEDEAVAGALQAQNLIPLTYVDERVFSNQFSVFSSPLKTENRTLNTEYPYNPNGSILDIAALCNPAGNVMGLMPHPENHIFPWQHPRVHRGEAGMLGLRLFENGIRNA